MAMYRNGSARRSTAAAGGHKIDSTSPAAASPQPTSQKMTVRVDRIHVDQRADDRWRRGRIGHDRLGNPGRPSHVVAPRDAEGWISTWWDVLRHDSDNLEVLGHHPRGSVDPSVVPRPKRGEVGV